MDDDAFAPVALRLAGQVAVLWGWTPAQFWSATPAELTTIFTAMLPGGARAVPTAHDLARLQEQFPDG